MGPKLIYLGTREAPWRMVPGCARDCREVRIAFSGLGKPGSLAPASEHKVKGLEPIL